MLKDVGKPITVLRVYQEHLESNLVGDLIFEYELPLNYKVERLNDSFIALSIQDGDQYVGFYFNKS